MKVTVKSDALFAREGFDIITTQFVTLSDVVLGTKVKVRTLQGDKEIEIKAGTQHGDKIKIKGAVTNNPPPHSPNLYISLLDRASLTSLRTIVRLETT